MLFYIRGYNLDLRPKDCVLTLCWLLNFHDWTPTNLSSRHSQGLSWDCKARHLPTVLWMLIVYLTYCCCSVTKSCLTFCDPLDCSMPGFPVLHHLPELAHVHWVVNAIQPSHLLSSPSPPALSLSQHQGLFQWVGSSHQVAKVLELQFQHQSFQRIFRTDFL